jgi:hypothetical protein
MAISASVDSETPRREANSTNLRFSSLEGRAGQGQVCGFNFSGRLLLVRDSDSFSLQRCCDLYSALDVNILGATSAKGSQEIELGRGRCWSACLLKLFPRRISNAKLLGVLVHIPSKFSGFLG